MAEKLVKYKLIKFGNGWVTPTGIYEGGQIWSQGEGVEEMVLVGKADINSKKPLPEGIIEIVKKTDVEDNNVVLETSALKNYKRERYKRELDPLAIEAMRDKLLGDDTKWNEYVKKHEEIHSLESIPNV